MDTGVFAEDRYFDVFVEYAKPVPTDVLIRITRGNRGPDAATLHVLPTLWFRNTWTWWPERPKPSLHGGRLARSSRRMPNSAIHPGLRGNPPLLFTENETNDERLFGSPNRTPYVKDGINDYVVAGKQEAVNPGAPEPRRPRTTGSMSAHMRHR